MTCGLKSRLFLSESFQQEFVALHTYAIILQTTSFLTELNKSFEMSSFVETGATAILKESPVEFVKYP